MALWTATIDRSLESSGDWAPLNRSVSRYGYLYAASCRPRLGDSFSLIVSSVAFALIWYLRPDTVGSSLIHS